VPVVVELLPLRERLATSAGDAASCRRTPQRRATHAYPARCIFSNGGADPSTSPSSGAAQRHHHQIAGGNPRSAGLRCARIRNARIRVQSADSGGPPHRRGSNPAESTGSGRGRLGIWGDSGAGSAHLQRDAKVKAPYGTRLVI
jgi:hypothetical protein